MGGTPAPRARARRVGLAWRLFAAALALHAALFLASASMHAIADPGPALISYVDPFLGTADHGHTFPGAAVPFGMVQLSPDVPGDGWEFSSGYTWNATAIAGFSHTHLSGAGIPELQDVSLLPLPAAKGLDLAAISEGDRVPLETPFSHADEAAAPGYYRVVLGTGVKVELTASARTGLHRYTFPAVPPGAPAEAWPAVALTLGFHQLTPETEGQVVLDTVSNRNVQGVRVSNGWAPGHKVYFAMEFSRPWAAAALAADAAAAPPGAGAARGDGVVALFTFMPEGEEERAGPEAEAAPRPLELLVKVGLSSTSAAAAAAALAAEAPGWDFDGARVAAAVAWETELRAVEVEGGDDELKTVFYTALYHTKLAPTVHSDADGAYAGPDGKVRSAKGFDFYTTLSIWDTFRAAHPLLTILDPQRANDVVATLLEHADHSDGHLLPIWTLGGRETYEMPGYHAVVMLAEAVTKGLLAGAAEVKRAYKAMKKTARSGERGGDTMEEYGFIPVDDWMQSVTTSLELGYDDWCVGRVAEAAGKMADAAGYFKRSAAYRHLFDPGTGFMRARFANGSFREPFNPYFSAHGDGDYTEGTAFQAQWYVPHDIEGLMQLFGGPAAFETRLDALFAAEERVDGEEASVDITGMIGQYVHGNEPSHHVAYLYNFAGSPHKTQAWVREIMDRMYSANRTAALAGNEDCGQMSAWYVFSALGFYPVNPADGRYALGSPRFDRAVIHLQGGRRFEVRAPGAASQGLVYVKKGRLNGKPVRKQYLEHAEIMAGGVLELEMSAEPAGLLWR